MVTTLVTTTGSDNGNTIENLKKPSTATCSNLVPSEHEMMVYSTMAHQAVTSKMYRGIGDASGVMMIMLAARELGIPPMQALNGGINIINGKVEISARMMSALIRKAGHSIKIKESTDALCVLIGKRVDTGETEEVSFSFIDAQKAGLVKAGGGWQKFPKDMCFARALSRLARQLFSDVVGIGYVEGEIKANEGVSCAPEIVEISMPTLDEQKIIADRTIEYYGLFDTDDELIALEYLNVVSKHFEWTIGQTLEELMKDKIKLKEKFSAWKLKKMGVAA